MEYLNSKNHHNPNQNHSDSMRRNQVLTLLESANWCFHKLSIERKDEFKPTIEQITTLSLSGCNFIINANVMNESMLNENASTNEEVMSHLGLFAKSISLLKQGLITTSNPKRVNNFLI